MSENTTPSPIARKHPSEASASASAHECPSATQPSAAFASVTSIRPSEASANAAAPTHGAAAGTAESMPTTSRPAASTDAHAADDFSPTLLACNWNEEWKRLQKARRAADDASYWDKRAKTFSTKDSPSPYVNRFLELAGIRPGESVFDMGCGTGALSIPLGQTGHPVVAADFSTGMLGIMKQELAAHDINSVKPLQMSWEDDWEAHGVTPGSADVCVASRSIAVADLKQALLKLDAVACRRVCITLSTGASPRTDEQVLAATGLQSLLGHDHLYAFNILVACGIKAEIAYIESSRADTFDTPEQAFGEYAKMLENAAACLPREQLDAALGRLGPWLESQLVENERAGMPDRKGIPEGHLRLRTPRTITWAFLAWNKQ